MRPNKHPIAQDELMAYLDGELSTDRATAAVAHLERCLECQAFASELRNISRELMAWEVESPDAHIPEKIATALDEHEQKPRQEASASLAFGRRSMARRWVWAAAFAALCVVVGLGIKPLTRHQALEKFSATLVPPPAGGGGGGYAVQARKDTDGLFQGLGQAENSFAYSGKPLSSQQSKEFDRLQQVGKLENPPGDRFQTPEAVGPMIIRTAGITITTRDFNNARASVDEILKRHHGYMGEMNVSTPTGSGQSFTATLRVPSDQLDAAMADLRKLGRVESESQSGQEVTAQYVDLQARLGNARNTEQRLTDLLRQRTGKLSDVLAVETEIDRVRGEIEQMEAARKNLASQIEFATINATVGEDYKAELQVVPISTSSRIRNAAVEGYRSMVDGVIGVALFLFSYGPSLLLWGAILFFPARFTWKKIQRHFAR